MMEKPNLTTKILGLLEGDPLTASEIAFSLEYSLWSVRHAISALHGLGLVVQVPRTRTIRPPGTKHEVQWTLTTKEKKS